MRKKAWLIVLAIFMAIVPGIWNQGFVSLGRAQDAVTVPPLVSPPSPGAPGSPSPTPLPAPPVSAAPPTALASTYRDPAGRFQVGVLPEYRVSPLAGSVLIEAPDGQLAYTVVAQTQPISSPLGLVPGTDNDALARVATTLFQRGEGFQPGLPRPEAGGGVVLDWTGNLTIAGQTQPVGGLVLVRPSARQILLLLVAATQAGADRLPGAVSALAGSLEAL